MVSDGQHSIRLAIAKVWPDVPHQLCHFHYLREAALPIFEADRHAKKELKKAVRGVRPIERTVEGRTDEAARIVQGYCAAVRSALTDDGPLEAAGLRLHDRLEAIEASLGRIEEKGNCPGSPFAGVNSTCTGRKTVDFQHLNGALAYHHRAKRAYFGQYRDRFSIFACN